MISFWANLTGLDIEAYARSLMLPDFMAHLVMEPFDFGIQDHNGDGRTPILIRYSGQGRREEIRLAPERHVEPIIKRLPNRVDLTKITFSKEGGLWNWSRPGNEAEDELSLRVFFHPRSLTLNQTSSRLFPPDEAYVSVSRCEIFMAHHVLEDYIVARYRQILIDPDAEIPTPEIDYSAGTYRFRFDGVGGTFIPDDHEMEGDIILFAGLKGPLDYVTEYLVGPPSASRARFDSEGVNIRLDVKNGSDQ